MGNIKNLLENFQNFDDCILLSIKWTDFGNTLELTFDYIWDENGKLRHNLNEEEPIVLRFKLVQEFNFKSGLNKSMVLEPEQINWGINEISCIRLLESSDMLKQYESLPKGFHHVGIFWEFDRQIDIIFSEMEIIKRGLKIASFKS